MKIFLSLLTLVFSVSNTYAGDMEDTSQVLEQLLKSHDYEGAINFYSKAYDHYPQTTSNALRKQIFFKARELKRSNDCDNALDLLSLYTNIFYQDGYAHGFMADCYAETGDAFAELESLLAAYEGVYETEEQVSLLRRVYTEVVNFVKSDADIEQRITLLERVSNLFSDNTYYYLELARSYAQAERKSDALATLEYIRYDPTYGRQANQLIRKLTDIETRVAEQSTPKRKIKSGIPLKRIGSQYLVDAVVNGYHRVTLLIDTGASITTLSPGVIASMGLNASNRKIKLNTANGIVDTSLFKLRDVRLGKHKVASVDVAAVELNGMRVDGLLGMDLLRNFSFEIDQTESVLLLSPR